MPEPRFIQLPKVPQAFDERSMRNLMQAVRHNLQQIIEKGISSEQFRTIYLGTVGTGGTSTTPEAPDAVTPVGTPGIVSNLTATGAYSSILLDWIGPLDTGWTHFEVWRAEVESLAEARRWAKVDVEGYSDSPPTAGVPYYYWVRAAIDENFGPWAGPVSAQIVPDFDTIYDGIQDQIFNDPLFTSLGGRVDLIEFDLSAIEGDIASINAQIMDLSGATPFDANTAYEVGDLVTYNGRLYICIQATTPPSPLPTDPAYWDDIGAYASLGEAVAAHSNQIDINISDIAAEVTRVDQLFADVYNATTGLSSRATIVYVDQVEADIYGAAVSQFSQINAALYDPVTGLDATKASIVQLNQAVADIYGAAVTSFTQINAALYDPTTGIATTKADITYVDQTAVDIYGAAVSQFTNINAALGVADNLVNPLNILGWTDGWALPLTAALETATVGGRTGVMLRDQRGTSVVTPSDWFDIDPGAIYEVSFNLQSNSAGLNSLGLDTAVAGSEAVTTATRTVNPDGSVAGTVDADPYLLNGFRGNNAWRSYRCYLFGPDADTTAPLPPSQSTTRYGYKLEPGQTRVRLTLEGGLSLDYTPHIYYWTNVSVRRISDTSIAGVTQLNTAISDAEAGAVATATQQVYTSLGGSQAVVEAKAQSWDGTTAQWSVKAQVNDLVGGIGLLNDGVSTRLYVQADRFAVYGSAVPGDTSLGIPFVVENGVTYIKDASIRDAAIKTAQIDDLAVTTAKIGGLQVTDAKIASLAVSKIQAGTISVNLTLAGSIIVSTNGFIRSGQETYDTGTGWWLGTVSNTPRFSIGNGSNQYMRWSGSALQTSKLVVNGAEIYNSPLEANSARIHTGGGRTAPFVIYDINQDQKSEFAPDAQAIVGPFYGPSYLTGHYHKRLAFQNQDALIQITGQYLGPGGSPASDYRLELSYRTNGGIWEVPLRTYFLEATTDGGHVSGTFVRRFTTPNTWNTLDFRGRLYRGSGTNASDIIVTLSVFFNNANQSNPVNEATSGDASTVPLPPIVWEPPPGGILP